MDCHTLLVVMNRSIELENTLQNALSRGHSVWVVGDVHGHFKTLEALLVKLNLQEGDHVVLLGDMIDRGPDSAKVVKLVRSTENLHSLMGNHEDMMVGGFDEDVLFKEGIDGVYWYHNGGLATVNSYIAENDDQGDDSLIAQVQDDIEWMKELPHQLVLDGWRLVHAGYNPNHHVDEQTEADLMMIRTLFHRIDKPIDEQRVIVFGHTVTCNLPGNSVMDLGSVWYHPTKLADGRNSAIGIDTCVFHDRELPARLTALNLQTETIVQQDRVV